MEHEYNNNNNNIEHIYKHLNNEMDDCLKYIKMSNIIKNSDTELSYYLLEMAKDEYTHASFIYNYLEKKNYNISEDLKNKFLEVEKEATDYFFV